MTDSTSTLQPASAEDVRECVQAALSQGSPLEVVGGGSKRFYGRAVAAPRTLAMSRCAGIVDYQPGELIAVARPATPLAELEAALAEKGQELAFEPPHWGAAATIGGTVACNLSGPRRFRSGAARDHLLGFQAVTGRGDLVAGGGKVVKNVTGYDLSKLMCGSFGTLAVLTEVVVKVLPAAESERTVVVEGLEDAAGVALLIAAGGSPSDPSALAHLPRGVAPTAAGDGATARTLLRVEGPAPSAIQRAEALRALAAGPATILEPEESRAAWRAIREVEPLPCGEGEALWRCTVPPTGAAACAEALREAGAARVCFDWGGGLLWAVLPGGDGAAVHRAAAAAGGHGRLVRASAAMNGGADVFTPLAPVNRKLHEQLKLAFDPQGILNPGRMYPGL